jgi:hypothetical protein
MLPADHGDAILLEYGPGRRLRYRVLIDGGAETAYRDVRERLRAIRPDRQGRRRIDLLVISHVDADHIEGVIKLVQDDELAVRVGDVWFNDWNHLEPLVAGEAPTHLGPEQGEFLGALLQQRGPSVEPGVPRWHDRGPTSGVAPVSSAGRHAVHHRVAHHRHVDRAPPAMAVRHRGRRLPARFPRQGARAVRGPALVQGPEAVGARRRAVSQDPRSLGGQRFEHRRHRRVPRSPSVARRRRARRRAARRRRAVARRGSGDPCRTRRTGAVRRVQAGAPRQLEEPDASAARCHRLPPRTWCRPAASASATPTSTR